MNIIKFASLLAAASSGNDKPSFLRTGSGDADAMTCVNEGVDAMCCLHTNGADTGGFEGCYTCVAKVIEDLVTDDATCESLATTTICEDIYACFVGDDAQCAGAACVTELTAYGECPKEEECPDLCPSLEHVGLNLASMIA